MNFDFNLTFVVGTPFNGEETVYKKEDLIHDCWWILIKIIHVGVK